MLISETTIKLQVKIEIFCLHKANFYTKYTKLVDIKNIGISSPVSILKVTYKNGPISIYYFNPAEREGWAQMPL